MVLGTYIGARWVPGGHALLLGFVNLVVHAFMYFYYFLTIVKPELKQSIWWKRNTTHLQLVNNQKIFLQLHFVNFNHLLGSVWNPHVLLPAGLFLRHLWLPKVLAVGIGDTKHVYARAFWRLLSQGIFIQEIKYKWKITLKFAVTCSALQIFLECFTLEFYE